MHRKSILLNAIRVFLIIVGLFVPLLHPRSVYAGTFAYIEFGLGNAGGIEAELEEDVGVKFKYEADPWWDGEPPYPAYIRLKEEGHDAPLKTAVIEVECGAPGFPNSSYCPCAYPSFCYCALSGGYYYPPEFQDLRLSELVYDDDGDGVVRLFVEVEVDDAWTNTKGSSQVREIIVGPNTPALLSPADGTVTYDPVSTFSWYSARGARNYQIQVDDDPNFYPPLLVDASSIATSYTLGSPLPLGIYYWRVKAHNAAASSDWSSTWVFSIVPPPPASPSNLRAIAVSQTQVNLFWNDNSDNEDGFKIYRDGSYLITVGANVTTYQDTGLSCGTTYWYRVTAYNTSGESDPTDPAGTTTYPCPTPPDPPSNLQAIAISQTQINLYWNDNSDNEMGFAIYYGDGSYVDRVGANVTSYQDTGLNCGTYYSYYILAWNYEGFSSPSNTAGATTHPCPETVPNPPSNLSATAVSRSQINLSWSDNSNNEDGFKIYRNGSCRASVGANVTSYHDTGLSCGTSYSYYVTAYNSGGESSPSNTASATTHSCDHEVIPGDANGDGQVNAIDITKTERIVVGLDEPTPGADANQDGQINALDITKIELIIVGLS